LMDQMFNCPKVWKHFLASNDNKADLASYLSDYLIQNCQELPRNCELVIGGGFSTMTEAKSSKRRHIKLHGNHEEADTRLILHLCEAVHMGYSRILVICNDTDVMLLLIHFLPHDASEVWMICGSRQSHKSYPIHVIASKLSSSVKIY